MTDAEATAEYRSFARGLIAEGFTVIDIMESGDLPSHSILMDLDSIVVESCESMEKETPSTWGKR
jgi:hypothetical protein